MDNKLEIGLSTYRNCHEARSYRKRARHPWQAIEKHSSINAQGLKSSKLEKPREKIVSFQERHSVSFVLAPH